MLLLIQGQGHRLRNECDVCVKMFSEVFLLFMFLTVSTYDCRSKVSITKGWTHITAQHPSIGVYVNPYKCKHFGSKFCLKCFSFAYIFESFLSRLLMFDACYFCMVTG